MLHKKDIINPEKLAVCGRCHHEFYKANMRRCPHPQVQKLCGEWICYYCCIHCSFALKDEKTGGRRCGYKEKQHGV